MKIIKKMYFCPVCGYEDDKSTNHYGEIYSGCKNCKNVVLYCKERECNKIPESKCRIIFYHFDLNKEGQEREYNKLEEELFKKGYNKFDTLDEYSAYKALKEYNNKTTNIYNIKQFDNQYISDIGRIFNWYEYIWDNKKIKDGYYLEFE